MNIYLVYFSEAFITDTYLGWLNDRELMRYSEQRHSTHTAESSRAYLKSMRDSGNEMWAVMNDGYHIGNVSAYIDKRNSVADLAILIGKPGKGAGTLAWSDAIEKLRGRVRKVEAGTMATNRAMRCIFANSGMEIEGIRKNHFVVSDGYADMVMAGKFL